MDIKSIENLKSQVWGLRQQADALQAVQPSIAQQLRAQASAIEASITNEVTPSKSDRFVEGFLAGSIAGAFALTVLFRK